MQNVSFTLPIIESLQQLEKKSKEAGMLPTFDYTRFTGIITTVLTIKNKANG